MLLNMVRAESNNQIGRVVIKFDPVFMMNNFARLESSAKHLFSHVAMLKDALPVYDENAIPVIPDETLSLSICGFFEKERISVSLPSKPMLIAKPVTHDLAPASFDCAEIGDRVGNEFPGFVFKNSVHASSSLTISLQQTVTVVKRNEDIKRVNSGEPRPGNAEGNPERSREYTLGTCNDYRRGKAPLITGMSARPEREEIVYSLQ